MYPEKPRSNWWYLLPIFLGIIGGIIAYFAIRKDDLPKAKKCIYLGLILLAVGIIIDNGFITYEWVCQLFLTPGMV